MWQRLSLAWWTCDGSNAASWCFSFLLFLCFAINMGFIYFRDVFVVLREVRWAIQRFLGGVVGEEQFGGLTFPHIDSFPLGVRLFCEAYCSFDPFKAFYPASCFRNAGYFALSCEVGVGPPDSFGLVCFIIRFPHSRVLAGASLYWLISQCISFDLGSSPSRSVRAGCCYAPRLRAFSLGRAFKR
jgi:hypothetical protein